MSIAVTDPRPVGGAEETFTPVVAAIRNRRDAARGAFVDFLTVPVHELVV